MDRPLSPANNCCSRLAQSLLAAASLVLAACDAPMPDSAAPLAESEAAPKTVTETCWEDLDPPAASEASPEATPNVTRFQIPCPAALPDDFIASLQRALAARDLYHGAITGRMDAPTRAAVRSYQQPEGIDSAVLSLAAARKLGLVAIERPKN